MVGMSEMTTVEGPRFEVPTSLSPSRVDSFTKCPMAFRFTSIERLGDVPSIHTTRGSMVHRALQLAFTNPPEQRTEAVFAAAAEAAIAEFRAHPDVTLLGLDADRLTDLEESCRILVRRYLTMEDPTTIRPIGLELMLSARVGNLTLRGIIDRLELRDGELVVSDYKTGRPPSINWEGRSLDGVHFYAMLCERVLGRLPVAIRLLYLSTGETLETKPSDRSARFVATRTEAVWKAVERACATGDFQPRPSALCDSCAFQRWCPAWGGNADRAHLEAPAALGLVAA
jgi:putative RecB family exonuclease